MTDTITEAVARAMFDWGHDEGWECGELETKRIYLEDARAAIRALYAALEEEGWQVVPREAVPGQFWELGQAADPHSMAASWYKNMVAAAPKPPGAE